MYFALFTGVAIFESSASVAEVFRAPDIHASLFFAFFMLDDPPTSPVRYRDQIVFGAIVALSAYLVFMRLGAVYYLLAGLLVGNLVEAIRRTVARQRRLHKSARRSQPAIARAGRASPDATSATGRAAIRISDHPRA